MLKLVKILSWRKIKMFKLNQEKLIKHINSTWKTKNCPYCNQNNWNVGGGIVSTVSVSENKDIQLGGRFQPLVTVTCNNCGNTVFVNALIADAIDMDEEEK